MSRASGVPDTAQRSRSNIPDLWKVIPVKVYLEDGKMSS